MIPGVDCFGARISRLLLGDNPIDSHSYIPELWSREDMTVCYTEENTLKDLAEAQTLGYTAMVPLPTTSCCAPCGITI